MGVNLKGTGASGIKTIKSECFGQPDHTKAAAISLFGQLTPSTSARRKYSDIVARPNDRFCATRRPENPSDRSCKASRIFRIGNLFMKALSCSK
jgi:hypothetical protein